MGQKLTKQDVRDAVQHAFEQTKAVTGGKNADYIPYLANVPSDLFGIAVCLPDGEIIAAGDTEYKFGIESVSKVPTAILTMNQYSPEEVLTKIGADATGLPFNSIMAILLEKDHPSTPLVNAGAIAACSMIKPIGKPDAKWEAIQGFIEGLCGSSVEVIDELYKSETATNFNNKSIAWLLKNYSRIYDDPDMALDLYTRQCSDRRNGPPTGGRGCDHRIRRREPRNQTDGLQARSGYAHRLDDGHRRFLRAYGRLALQHGPSGQDRRGRRHHGRRSGRDGRSGLRTPTG